MTKITRMTLGGMLLAGMATLIALLVSPLILDWSIGMLPDAVTLLKAPGIDVRVVAATAAIVMIPAALSFGVGARLRLPIDLLSMPLVAVCWQAVATLTRSLQRP